VDPIVEARRWKRELDLAEKREKDWRDESDKIIKRYRGEERKKGRYNILWANTEILRPAIYNTPAKPDVRRRFRDADPLGKAVSTVLERALDIVVDDYGTDCAIKNDVLDGLLPGRGVTRIRYVPKISQTPLKDSDAKEGDDEGDSPQVEEAVEYESVDYEHIDWRDFRHGYGRVWAEVEWVAFRCKLTKAEAEKMLGADAIEGIEFTLQQEADAKRPTETVGETLKLAEFWNVWDRTSQREFFIQDDAEKLLFTLENPKGQPSLELDGFFPIPEPLKLIENTGSLEPIPPFVLYRDQAEELDRVSIRISKIVDAIRVRGVYDSKLSELQDLVDSGDNQLTPVQNAQAWLQSGLDKAISWMPIEPQAKVLAVLYESFQALKERIDGLTGISDIIRGKTVASETATAQQLKSNYASIRLQRMRKEVERYVRDLLRLASEVISSKFGVDTLQKMTQLQLPTPEQKAQAMTAMQQAQQTGQPPPPQIEQVLKLPTWDDVMGVLRSDAMRQFKVDVETDSTVAGSLQTDMQGLSEVLGAITTTLTGLAPLVQAKALPVEAAKEIVLSVVRRARMGLAVEDAFDKLQEPQAPPQPEVPPDNSPQVAQIKAQSDQQVAQMKAQTDTQIAATNADRDVQIEQARQAEETKREQMRILAQAEQAELDRQAQAAQAAQQQSAEDQRQLREHEHNLQTASMSQEHETRTKQMDGEQKLAVAHPPKAKKRVGKAKLPSGGTLEFEISDAPEKAN
jgi:hypothetical protein